MFKVNAWSRSGVFIVNFEYILHLVSIVKFEPVNAGWVYLSCMVLKNDQIYFKNLGVFTFFTCSRYHFSALCTKLLRAGDVMKVSCIIYHNDDDIYFFT